MVFHSCLNAEKFTSLSMNQQSILKVFLTFRHVTKNLLPAKPTGNVGNYTNSVDAIEIMDFNGTYIENIVTFRDSTTDSLISLPAIPLLNHKAQNLPLIMLNALPDEIAREFHQHATVQNTTAIIYVSPPPAPSLNSLFVSPALDLMRPGGAQKSRARPGHLPRPGRLLPKRLVAAIIRHPGIKYNKGPEVLFRARPAAIITPRKVGGGSRRRRLRLCRSRVITGIPRKNVVLSTAVVKNNRTRLLITHYNINITPLLLGFRKNGKDNSEYTANLQQRHVSNEKQFTHELLQITYI